MFKKIAGAALVIAAVTLGLAVPGAAQASTSCGGWGTWNRDGEYAKLTNVVPERGMNCASSRYVVNRWLKRAYQRQYANRLPTRFYDGYVTWHCGKTYGYNWRCREYSSGTSFRFRAVYYGYWDI